MRVLAQYTARGVPLLCSKCHRLILNILVDTVSILSYNRAMTQTTTTRKRRTDRNHIIYEIRTAEGSYIGVTAKTESTVLKSIRSRAAKHFYRAKKESKEWLLCAVLRGYNSKDEIDIRAVEMIRGKKAAHARERELIAEMNPELNTDKRGM
jgi:hypothetical protein